MEDVALTLEGQEVGDVVPKDNNDVRKILAQLNHELQEFEEMFQENISNRETDFQPPTWSTCEGQTQTDSWSTCEGQTQTDSWSTCEGQTQTDSWSSGEVEFKAELELAREKLAKKETEHQEACEKLMQLQSLNHNLQKELEQANDNSRKHESERQEACEKLIELQLLRKKELKENFEQFRFLKQRLEEQFSVGNSLTKQISESEIQSQKVETLELQLQEFEDMKVKYSLSVEQNQNLEREFKEHFKELKMVKQQLEEQVSVGKKLETQISERASDKKKIEMLERQLQEFEELKEEFCWSVRQNQSLEKELQLLQKMKPVTQSEDQVAVQKTLGIQSLTDKKKIEMLERQLQEFEDIKEEYTWSVGQNQSLEKDLEQAQEISRKHEAERKEACEKLIELKLLHQKVLDDHLEELSIFKEGFKQQMGVRKRLEQQISEVVPLEKPSMCDTQTQTVASTETLTDLKEVKAENSTSNVQPQNLVQRTRALFEKPQTSADESRPQSWKDDCTELNGNVNQLTQILDGKLEQDTQEQGSELKRNRVKGKNVAALMKRFEF